MRATIAAAALLGAISMAPPALGQSLDAAPVRANVLPSASAKSDGERPAQAVASSFLVDLGPFEGGASALASQPGAGPPLVGLHRPVPHTFSGDLIPQLTWSSDDPHGPARAAFQICSRGAAAVRARIAATLPDEAHVTVFDAEGRSPREPWSGADIAEDGADGAWLPSQEGECLTVETTLAHEDDAQGATLALRSVAHRFTSAELERAHAARRAGQSTPGDIVPRHGSGPKCPARYISACDRLDAQEDVIPHATAVAHYHYETGTGSFSCSGTLLNDGKDGGGPRHPLFLTAAHCVHSDAEVRSMDLVFDWVGPRCRTEPEKRVSRPSTRLATAPEYDQTLVRLPHWPVPHSVAGRYAMGWNAESVEAGTPARTLHHPGGAQLAYTASTVTGVSPSRLIGGSLRYKTIEVLERDGITEQGSSGSALVMADGTGQIIGALSGGPDVGPACAGWLPPTGVYGGFRDFYPRIAQFLSTGPVAPPVNEYRIPLVLRAHPAREGFVRISSAAGTSGHVRMTAVDDRGKRHGPATLPIGPAASIHFTASHLERGGRGLPGWGAPAGGGHWRLEIAAGVPLDVRAYVRTADGFVTSMSQATELWSNAAESDELHAVPFINPASNTRQRSYLRITNHGARATRVNLQLWDDSGMSPELVAFRIGAGETHQIGAKAIEAQAGDGAGKWKGLVSATPPVQLTILSILDTPTGHVTNVSR